MTLHNATQRGAGHVVPTKARIAYGLGDLGSHFTWTFVGSYLVLFYTDIAMIPAVTVGVIMLIARVWDAVDDPLQGYISERIRTRWGRFRPFILFGAPLLTVFLIMTFTAPDFGDMTAKVVYAAITYILLGVFFSAVNMSYGALAGVMTKDYDERLILNWWRGMGSGLGQLILAMFAMPLILFFSASEKPTAQGFTTTAVVLGLLSLPIFLFIFATAREVIVPDKSETSIPLSQTIRTVLGNGQLMIVLFALLFNLTGLFGRLAILVFYVIQNMHSPQLVAGVMTTFGAAGFIGQVLFPRLASVFGKKWMVITSMVIAGVVLVTLFFVPPTNTVMVFVLIAIHGLTNFGAPIITSMIPDAVDYQEYTHGVRSDGSSYAMSSFFVKLAGAIGAAMGAFIIGAFGYVGGQQASPDALRGINIAANLVPALCAFAAAFVMLFYKLSGDRVQEMRAEIDRRNAHHEEELRGER